MLIGIDHLVIAVAQPDAAAAELGAALGIAFTGGGRHPGAGTANRLAFFGDTYLELVGVQDRDLAAAHPVFAAVVATLDRGGGALATFAVTSDDIEGDVARLRLSGSSIELPVPGERRRPDGEVVRWRTAVAAPPGPAAPPFLIEHEMAGAEWGRAARSSRARFEHPVGGRLRLVGLELAVADPAATADAYRRQVGLAMEPAAAAAPGEREVRVGEQAIRLVHFGDGTPAALVGLRGSTGERAIVDAFGVRFTRL